MESYRSSLTAYKKPQNDASFKQIIKICFNSLKSIEKDDVYNRVVYFNYLISAINRGLMVSKDHQFYLELMNELYLNHETFWDDINGEEFSFVSQHIHIEIGFQWMLISMNNHIDTPIAVLDKFIEHYKTIESLFAKLKSSIKIMESEYGLLGWNLCMRMLDKNHKMSFYYHNKVYAGVLNQWFYSEIYDMVV